MNHSTYFIAHMDCPAEERLIRLKLEGKQGIHQLRFDLSSRRLEIWHTCQAQSVDHWLHELVLGSQRIETKESNWEQRDSRSDAAMLWQVLSINATLFVIECGLGWWYGSMGLMADGLDMLADALVYGLALLATYRPQFNRLFISKMAGVLQILLAIGGLYELFDRFINGVDVPDFAAMIFVSTVALTGNILCLKLLQKASSKEAHMKASLIFTSNDVWVNLGVIVAAVFVYLAQSSWPDLVVGLIVYAMVLRGAYRIMKLQ